MFLVAMIGVVITMALGLLRASLGPTVYDRILALNGFGTQTVLLIGVSGFLFGRPEWLDLALVYALINYVGTLAVLRYSKYGSLDLDQQPKGGM
jgi:multicomponent Na+:H+ antiporter subunit F